MTIEVQPRARDDNEGNSIGNGTMKDENAPLLPKNEYGDKSGNAVFRTKTPKRTFVVEPLIFLFGLAFSAYSPISKQFLYARIAEEMNVSYSSNSSSHCVQEDAEDPTYVAQQQVLEMIRRKSKI